MEKVKVIVPCYIPCNYYQDDVYFPIQTGRDVRRFSELDKLQGDNTGDNISKKNPEYSEFSALYWGWKNLDCEYIGMCHNRRYFVEKITKDNVEDLLRGCDIILREKAYLDCNLKKFLSNAVTDEDFFIFYNVIIKLYPQYKDVVEHYYFKNNAFPPCNMFLCKKELFDEYASFTFGILAEFEKYAKPSGYTRLRRALGYMGETLFGLFVEIRNLRVRELPIVGMIGNHISYKQRLIDKLYEYRSRLYFKMTSQKVEWTGAMIVGMKQDGIYEKLMV